MMAPEDTCSLHDEALTVRMATALFCCGRLWDPFSRAACYVAAGISNRGYAEGRFLVLDLTAVRYERIRRTLHRMGGE